MAYVRRKRIKGHDYYYLVESYRLGRKVKNRTLKYLGTYPEVPDEFKPLLNAKRRRKQRTLWDPEALAQAIVRQVKAGPVNTVIAPK